MPHRDRHPNVLVTGAAGFIGSHLLKFLSAKGFYITALDIIKPWENNAFYADQWFECDLANKEQLEDVAKEISADYIVHLAAVAAPNYAEANPELTFKTNVLGTFHVLKLAKVIGAKRFIFASSAHVYGISPKYMPTDESHPIALQDTYTTSKILGESLCELFWKNHNLSYCVLRLFNGYGPGQKKGYFIPDMLEKAKAGIIKLKGSKVTKDFVYIDDIVAAIAKSLESCYVGPLNVGTGIQTSLDDIARLLATRFQAEYILDESEIKGPTHMQADITRIKSILDWTPETSIEDGLAQIIKNTELGL